jgi:hypothetical protein
MATHYARQKGIPACGEDVVDDRTSRTSKFAPSVSREIGKRVVSVAKTTSQTRSDVDCVPCIPFMDADNIPA